MPVVTSNFSFGRRFRRSAGKGSWSSTRTISASTTVASAAAARALSEARAPEALAAALAVAPAATGQLGWACDAVSRRLPTVVAIRAVAENENAATMSEHWLNACARALAVHSADDGVCGSTMARAIASSARQNLDDLEFPFLVIPSLHVLDRLYNGAGERRPSINCGRRASLLQLGMAQPAAGPPRLRTTDDRLAFQIAAALDRCELTTLVADFNGLGDDGAAAIAAALKGSKLETLSLASNGIGDRGAAMIAQELEGSSLTQLDLGSNDLGRAVQEQLAAARPAINVML